MMDETRPERVPPARGVTGWLRFGLPGRLAAFRKARSGAAAIEFAIVSIPFFLIVFAIIETALVFFAGQVLDSATTNAARLIRTGQAQQGGFSKADFKDKVCNGLAGLFDCDTRLVVDVRTESAFGSITYTPPLDEDGKLVDDSGYDPGGPGEIVVVRVFYEWPLFLNPFGGTLSNMAGGDRLLGSVAAFRNEPFPVTTAAADSGGHSG